MTSPPRPPDFDELVGGDVPSEERERLRRVHDLLVAAGPPPEVPPLEIEPPAEATVRFLPRRRRGALVILAAALTAAAFGGGYWAAGRGAEFDAERVYALHGVGRYADARGSVQVGEIDEAGNLPMVVRVTGLPKVKRDGYYELLLVRGRERLSCGNFLVKASGTTRVPLNGWYGLKAGDRFVVTIHPERHLDNPPVAMAS